ncbi:hypothetical protein pb186bvf_011089 [Paramecium bursaria]
MFKRVLLLPILIYAYIIYVEFPENIKNLNPVTDWQLKILVIIYALTTLIGIKFISIIFSIMIAILSYKHVDMLLNQPKEIEDYTILIKALQFDVLLIGTLIVSSFTDKEQPQTKAEILFFYSRYCKTSIQILNRFRIGFPIIEIDILNNYQPIHNISLPKSVPQIYLIKNETILKYEFDVFDADIKYWLNLYYNNEIPQIHHSIKHLNEIHENIIILYSNGSDLDQYKRYTWSNQLYYFVYSNNTNKDIKKEFNLTNEEQNYLLLIRKKDNVQNYTLLDNRTFDEQFRLFIKLFSQPYQQEYLTLRTLNYAKQRNISISVQIIGDYDDKEQLIYQEYVNFIKNRTENNNKTIYIQTKPLFLARKFISRFMQKDINKIPYLFHIKFNPFKFILYEKQNITKPDLFQWFQNINNGNSRFITYQELAQNTPYLKLSYQKSDHNIQIYNIDLLDRFVKFCKAQQCQIFIVKLIPYCIDSFKLYAKLQTLINPDTYIFYTYFQKLENKIYIYNLTNDKLEDYL